MEKRWKQSWDVLIAIECNATTAELGRAIKAVLTDAPRAGAPHQFAAEQVTHVLAIACESPALSQRPLDFWTARKIVDEAILRKVVTSISTSHVGRLLRSAMLQPHRCKYWLNTKEQDPVLFGQQVETVCQTYLIAGDLYFQCNTHTVCVDEMTSIQALERNSPKKPMRAGSPELLEFEYTRHGTQCLIANWHVVLGQMISPTVGDTRTEADFAQHIQTTVDTDPTAKWVFVMDQLNTHKSATLVKYVASVEGSMRNHWARKGSRGCSNRWRRGRSF